MNLSQLGWSHDYDVPSEEFTIGRVLLEHKGMYKVYDGEQEYVSEVNGKMRFQATGRHDYPAVGDFVWMKVQQSEGKAIIHGIFPRFSCFSRKVAGNKMEEQILATNINTVFLVSSLNHDFNIRRLERYLVVAYESGANPVIVLTKKDLCDDIEDKIQEVENIAFGVPIYAVDSLTQEGTLFLSSYCQEGQTVALLGSSGVGKSTLLNALMNEQVAKTGGIREDDAKGRHTTTHRELFFLPSGGMVIDTPGMRQLQLWDGGSSIDTTFSDVEDLAQTCRFHDCQHQQEPGCSVQDALQTGTLKQERFQSYLKLQKELAYAERKQNDAAARTEKEKWKKISKAQKQHYKHR
ncbi:MAG: ribosome small subunit-dependent GTPase A [Bacilli bacterium]